MSGRFAVLVSRNWRITFAWQGEESIEVDLEIWIRMQTAHDLWHARRDLSDTLTEITTLTAA